MDKEPKDIIALVDNTEKTEFYSLFNRMDEDFNGIWEMSADAYTVAGKEVESKTKKHGSELKVASNDLRVACDRIVAKLVNSEMQIRVSMPEQEGQDLRDDIAALERLLHFAFENADERLFRLLLPGLKQAVSWFGAVRGWMAGRFLVYKQGKSNVVFDFVPFDPRWLTYAVGENGLLWVNHKTFKSPAMLEQSYNYSPTGVAWFKPWSRSPASYPVYDFWKFDGKDKVTNSIICQDKVLSHEELKMPSMPIVITPVAIRPPVAGTEGIELKGYGESIFAEHRYINEIRNRFGSIVLNWANLLACKPLINYKTAQGRAITNVFGAPGDVLELTRGENELVSAPIAEISPTILAELNWLSEQMAQGIPPRIEMETPPASGTRYFMGQEAGEWVFNPQLRSLQNFYAAACRLIEEQLIAGGISVRVTGEDKKEQKYYEVRVKPVDLKVPHTVKVELTSDAPWRRLDTYQVAQMARQLGVPQGYINEFILKFPDPKGLDDLAAIELFEHSPKGSMARAIAALMKRGGTNDAFLALSVARDMDRMEKSEEMAIQGEPETEQAERPPLPKKPPLPPPPGGIEGGLGI